MNEIQKRFSAFGRYGVYTLLYTLAVNAAFAQSGTGPDGAPPGFVSATRLTYLGLASLVIWVVVFALVYLVYSSQRALSERLRRIEEENK